jgi:transcriptional regulator PpsR
MSFDFSEPELLMPADSRAMAALVTAAADLTLVVDGSDIIKDMSHNLALRPGSSLADWRGQAVDSVIDVASRPKLRRALKAARDGQRVQRFDVSHTIDGERALPIQYSALKIGSKGRIVLMGRDMRAVSDLQSRLLANRQAVDQTARSQKQAEAHYRLLFETGSDAIVFIDAESGKIRELNTRAGSLLDVANADASGKKFVSLFEKSRQADIRSMLSEVSVSGMPARLRIQLPASGVVTLVAELFRAADLSLTMVRLLATGEDATDADAANDFDVEALVRGASEAILLTDVEGKVFWTNESFLVLAGIPLAAHALGKSVDDFLAWSTIERESLLDAVRRHGRVPSFSVTVRGAKGQTTEVDLSAIAMGGATPGYGFVMRVSDADQPATGRGNSDLMRTAESLVEMIGRVPMKDLVRDTTDVIERMCIEAALKLTGNNRASTARVLGLSRQALYLKMHRFGIADAE